MSQNVRTFIAIEIDPIVRKAARELVELLRAADADVKWVEPENMHLTVKFLGDVALTETARICDAIQKAAVEVEPFDLELGGVGAFPNTTRPKTIWLGGQGDDRPMLALHESVEKHLQKLGFRREPRRFQPHLTLGRLKRPGPALQQLAELLDRLADCPAGISRVDELLLFSSQLTREGPVYHAIGRAKLGA